MVSNKSMTICSISYAIRKLLIKTMTYMHPLECWRYKIWSTWNADQAVEEHELSLLVRMQNDIAPVKDSLVVSYKANKTFIAIMVFTLTWRSWKGFPWWFSGKEPLPLQVQVWSLGQEDPPEEGNGSPLQYSRLGDPMDRGAWWVTVHGVTKSQTQQSNSACTPVLGCQYFF